MSTITPLRQKAPEPRGSGLRSLFRSSATKAFPRNALIYSESNHAADSVYMIESGRVKLFMSNADGKEIDIGDLGPGEIFGDTELDGGARSVSAMVVEPSRIVSVRQSEFRQYVQSNPEFAMELMLKLISRNRELLKTAKSLALMDVSDRVAQLLLEMATEENGKLIINGKVSKRNIANRVGATREMASRVFRGLIASGYIELENKRITVSRKMAGMLAAAGVAGLALVLILSGGPDNGASETAVASINSLPATAAGRPSSVAPVEAVTGVATGLVAQVYVKTAEGVLVEAGRTPDRAKEGMQRWVEVRFPEPVGGTAGSALALLGGTGDEVSPGDVVSVRFAQTRDPRAVTEKEAARVTAVVERKDSALARDLERRILARGGTSTPQH